MNLATALSAYLNLNLMLVLAFAGLAALHGCARRIFSARAELRLHYSVLGGVIVLALLQPLLPAPTFVKPAANIWSAHSLRDYNRGEGGETGGVLQMPQPLGAELVAANHVTEIWLALGLLTLIAGSALLARDLRSLNGIRRESYLARRVGRVRLLVNDNIQVPFSYWIPGEANVVLPAALLAKSDFAQIAIAHELQHHRHRDTQWVYLVWGLRLVSVLNPAMHLWSRLLSEIQEFACDETLVDQNKVASREYARCLIETAQSAVNRKFAPVCATGLLFLADRNLLQRRIESMFQRKSVRLGRSISVAAGLALSVTMGASALASRGLVQDRRVTLAQAREMATKSQSDTGFPIVVNDLVLNELNRFVGTPEGREYVRNALQRMEGYRSTVSLYSQKYGVPPEVMAVPIVESGYQNLAQGRSGDHGAGLWQFIPSTAHNFGLEVNRHRDERLEIGANTDAAMRYLQMNNLRFKDWALSLMAYNMGEQAVQHAIDVTGSRDAWTLIRRGYEGDHAYLARVVAAALIMKNPEVVQ